MLDIKKEEPSASEALYLFMGWLTSRDEMAGPFSSTHDAADAAQLVETYYQHQGWKEPRNRWPGINGAPPEAA